MSPDDRESLAHLLTNYESPAQIAESFATAGVKAVLGDPCECAVARYVKLYDFADVHVYLDSDNEVDFIVYADDEVFHIEHGDPMAEFIRAFDANRYPELVEDGTR